MYLSVFTTFLPQNLGLPSNIFDKFTPVVIRLARCLHILGLYSLGAPVVHLKSAHPSFFPLPFYPFPNTFSYISSIPVPLRYPSPISSPPLLFPFTFNYLISLPLPLSFLNFLCHFC